MTGKSAEREEFDSLSKILLAHMAEINEHQKIRDILMSLTVGCSKLMEPDIVIHKTVRHYSITKGLMNLQITHEHPMTLIVDIVYRYIKIIGYKEEDIMSR